MLYGVFPKDFMEILKIENKPSVERKIYTDMPTVWRPGCDWPQQSNLKCWICDEIPSGPPRFVPVNYCMSGKDEHSGVLGHFDKWICAARYILINYTGDKRADMMQALCIVESYESGKRKPCIPGCVMKTELKEYSGNGGITHAERDQRNAQLEAGTML
jgi:hypothetical protein